MTIDIEFFRENESGAEVLSQTKKLHLDMIQEFLEIPNRQIEDLIWLVPHFLILRKLSEFEESLDPRIDLAILNERVRQVWRDRRRAGGSFPDECTENWYRKVIEECFNVVLATSNETI